MVERKIDGGEKGEKNSDRAGGSRKKKDSDIEREDKERQRKKKGNRIGFAKFTA